MSVFTGALRQPPQSVGLFSSRAPHRPNPIALSALVRTRTRWTCSYLNFTWLLLISHNSLCYAIWYNFMSYNINHIIPYHHIISYHIISYHVMSCHVIWYHTKSCHMTSNYAISYYITLYHVISYYITLCHVISYHIILNHFVRQHSWNHQMLSAIYHYNSTWRI